MSTYPPLHKAIPGKPFRSLLRYNRPYLRAYAIGGSLALVVTLFSLVVPLGTREIIGGFEERTMTASLLLMYFGLILGAAVLMSIARYFQRMLMIGASRRFEYDLRNDLFRHVQQLSQRFFHTTPTGDIMARATNDLNYVREFIGPGIMGTADMIRIPFTLGMMIWLSAKLTLLSMIPLPLLTVLAFIFIRYLNKQSKVVQEIYSEVSTLVQENLAGARVVKAYGIESKESERFREKSRHYMGQNIRLVSVMAVAIPLLGILVGGIILIIVWQGGRMVILDEIDLADLTTFMLLLVMLIFPLAQLGYVLTLYQRGSVGMTRINNILQEVPDIRDDANTDPGAEVGEALIQFEEVSFCFGETEVIHNINFEVPSGSTTAIVGHTGSGKSTIVSLLAREYDPTQGAILVDGQDLRRIPVAHLRAAIGYVPQDTFIFSASIRENIAVGKPDASAAEIAAACELAQFTADLANMPQGLDTLLGERGINLSGGQKQRLTLARALIRDPKILLLDDALASVDTHTEERILSGLRGVMAQRTSIIVSHRVSTIRDADQIIVIEDGRIAESGDHAALMQHDGIYAEMYQRQLLETQLEDES